MQNFTLIDIQASALASLLFAVFAVSPGYVIGRLTNVFSFRQRLLSTQLLLSIALSLSVSPAAAYWIGRTGAMPAIWAAALTATAAMGDSLCGTGGGERRRVAYPQLQSS